MWNPFHDGKMSPYFFSTPELTWPYTYICHLTQSEKNGVIQRVAFLGQSLQLWKQTSQLFSWHFILIATQMHFSICLATGDNRARVKGSRRALLLHSGSSWWDYCCLLISEHRGSDGSAILWSIMQHIRCSQSTFIEELSWNNIFFLHLFCL